MSILGRKRYLFGFKGNLWGMTLRVWVALFYLCFGFFVALYLFEFFEDDVLEAATAQGPMKPMKPHLPRNPEAGVDTQYSSQKMSNFTKPHLPQAQDQGHIPKSSTIMKSNFIAPLQNYGGAPNVRAAYG